MSIACPLCDKSFADLHAIKQHLFSARHNDGQEVIDLLNSSLDDDQYSVAPQVAGVITEYDRGFMDGSKASEADVISAEATAQ